MKRIFTILFAAMLAGQAWATDYDFKIDNVCYSTWFGDAYVECENSSDDYANNYSGLTTVTIPDTVEYDGDKYPVVGISRDAFKNCSSLTSITLPNTIQRIREYAFEGCSSLESVVIPNSVTSLGENVFCNCASLASVTLPDTITYIPAAAFGNCSSLTSIEIPNTVTFIGNSAFSGSGLTSIEIPESVTEIASFAFKECDGLETITIPATVEKVQSWVFQGCDNLTVNCCATSIPAGWSTYWNDYNIPYNLGSCGEGRTWTVNLSANNSSYGSVSGGGTYADGSTITITATPASGYKFVKWSNDLTTATATITVTSDLNLVAEFAEISLQYEITGSNTVQVVHSEDYKNLTDVVIPETVEIEGKTYSVAQIGDSAFYNCSKLSSLTIPETVISIGKHAFANCSSLTSIAIPNSVCAYSYEGLFKGCSSLQSITLPFVFGPFGEIFGSEYYEGCIETKQVRYEGNMNEEEYTSYIPSSLKTVTINGGVICNGEFRNCRNIESIFISGTTTSIGWHAFANCSNLKSLTISESVSYIADAAFNDCESIETLSYNTNAVTQQFREKKALKTINIGESVTKISNYAFFLCSNLTSVTIPNSVESIGESAFDNCCNLKNVSVPSSVKTIGDDAFCLVVNVMYSGTASGSPWKACNINGTIDGDFIYADKKLTKLVAYIGQGGDVVIPESAKSIGDYAFSNTDITSVKFHNGVDSIGWGAFSGCTGLASVVIPEGVTGIDYYAFENCTNLKSISIPNSVTYVPDDVFEGCNSLQYNEYGNALYLGNDKNPYLWLTTAKSTDITTCTINDNCQHVMNEAFMGCKKLESVNIPNSVKTIGWYAFDGCDKFTTVTIPQTVEFVSSYAFGHCENLTVIYCGASERPDDWAYNWYYYDYDDSDKYQIVWSAITPITESAANTVNIYAFGNKIVVENATDEIRVYNAMGKLICRDVACRVCAEITVNATGVYIVKTGSAVKRVVVN